MSCVFCEIAAGRIPARIVLQDDRIVAFHDIAPKAPTHVVVIPREHLRDLDAVGEAQGGLLGALMLAARSVAARQGLAGGYRVVVNKGADGGQTVDHLHLHVLGGRALAWPPG
jgi:histidine triad (HIT) family protein